ncbi:helix-turn-helix domain-containing protein [Streptomyces sp. JV185]|uniref:ArsR/SmtB family transcription factor n=1 Tax=Streptomyces sp. JV185 TaxID=858638 RepID=UPI002E772FF9|nr:helix-turn-helix domain-containing protein [Streptomyces sp. JV185]MEE1772809.1 helix-turn-helix domain-containing protein [Streptomyces sp. JV185]
MDRQLSDVRLAPCELWQAFGAAALLVRYGPDVPWPHASWAREAHAALTPRLRSVVELARPRGRIPSFLSGGVTSRKAGVADELDDMVSASAGLVRDELAREYPQAFADPLVAALIRDPEAQLRYLAVEFSNFWRSAIEPRGLGLARSLEEEILFRSRTLAVGGGAALLRDLGFPSERTDGVDRVTAVPMLFADGTPWWSVAGGRTVLSFTARGAGLLHADPGPRGAEQPPREDRLAILLGRGRASVVRELAVPITTSALADHLGLAASTVSQHLSALVSAGVVQRHRAGTRVLYELNRSGVALTQCLTNK